MNITEEKIRQISKEAYHHLGPNANSEMLKKIVTEVVRRLTQEHAAPEETSGESA